MSAESALVVLIPEAEVAVGSLRQRFDPSAALGLPAHVTILYPFKPPAELTLDVIDQLAELFARVPPFDVSFSELAVRPVRVRNQIQDFGKVFPFTEGNLKGRNSREQLGQVADQIRC